MIQILKKIFGLGPKVDYHKMVQEGVQIIDVRTKEEFESGHIRGSVNIPLSSLDNRLTQIRKDKPVITCCASGMRSATAKSILKSKGYMEVYNGGGWRSLQAKLK
jgi:phage shock protein E